MFVHTAHGRGRIVDEQSVRGRKSFLVEGSGFKVWLDEKDLRVANDVNHDNSTTLPYDPTPQHPSDMFGSESTIQPTDSIDADERLTPSDSLSFDSEDMDYPGPSPDNFARQAGFLGDLLSRLPENEWDEEAISDWVRRHDPHGPVARGERGEDERSRTGGRHSFPEGDYVGRHRKENQGLEAPEKLNAAYDLFDFLYNASSAPIPGITANQHTATGRSVYDLMNEQPPGEPSGLGHLVFQPDGGRHHDDVMYGEHAFPEITSPPKGYRGRHREEEEGDIGPMMMYSDPREQALYQKHREKVQDFGRELQDRALHPYDPQFSDEMIPVPEDYVEPRQPYSFGRSASMEDLFDHEDEDDDMSIKHFSSLHYAGPSMYENFAEDAIDDAADDVVDILKRKAPGGKGKAGLDPNKLEDGRGKIEEIADEFAGDQNKKQVGGYWPGRPDGQTVTSALYERPAGLSDKYIQIQSHVDHYSDPVQQFRDDPVGFINKRGYMMSDSLDIRLAEYMDLVEYDPGIRTAAWKDVRTKALRLRREGRVHVKDLGPNRIYANVEGDSDTYETMILKGAGNDQSISDWHCSCPWGRWAFKRQMSYVGRLCSHGYASYLEMESQQMKANNKRGPDQIAHFAAHDGPPYGRSSIEREQIQALMDDWNLSPEEAVREYERRQENKTAARSKKSGIVEDFKQWADNENDGMIDQQAIDNFIYLLNSQQDGDHTIVSEEDAEKLYDALDGMKSTGKVRDYDVDYLERPGDVYKDASFDKEADVLALRPQSLTPDFYFVEDGQDGQYWTDVTKDERKTTGPDNMVRKSARHPRTPVDRSGSDGYSDDERSPIEDEDEFTGFGWENDPREQKLRKSRRLTGRELHYASDEELGQVVKDWAGAGSKLEKLRGLSAEGPDFQNMRDRNDEVREVIDELHTRGIDASQFVASLRFAADAEEDASSSDDEENAIPDSQQGQPSMEGKPNQTGQPGGSSSITKPDSSQTGGDAATPLANQQKGDPSAVGFNSYPDSSSPAGQSSREESTSSSNSGGSSAGISIDPNAIITGLGQAAGGIANAIPGILNALPNMSGGGGLGGVAGGIGSGLSGLVNGLSSGLETGLSGILASNHTATPIGGFPNVQLTNQESFQGSGPNPKYWMGSSECYVDDHERDRFVDVTDLDDDPLVKFVKNKPQQGPKKTGNRGSRHPFDDTFWDRYANSENSNPDGSTLTSGPEGNDTGVANLEQVYKAGATPGRPWDGHRIRDFRRFVKQQGSERPTHQHLQEYLSKPHRGLDQGGKQHLQDYISYAEQHEASRRYAEIPMADMATADIPGSSNLMPDDLMASGDRSDIVANFHRMGGIEAINNSGSGGGYSDAAIAEQAKGFLRTAGRMYSLAEQRALEEESHPKGARNLNELDLTGTHYEDAL